MVNKAKVALRKLKEASDTAADGTAAAEDNGIFDISQGVECHADAKQHFLCEDCLSRHIHTSVEDENLPTFEANECRLKCVVPTCASLYSDHAVARHASAQRFEEFLKAKMDIKERQLVKDIEAGVEQRIEAQVRECSNLLRWNACTLRLSLPHFFPSLPLFFFFFVSLCLTLTHAKIIAAMSDYEKRIRRHRKHVIERILTLACPRCSRAFIGFTDCFALKCSAFVKGDPNSCCQFCAYCLKDCGRDAHSHVLDGNCPGAKGLFQTKKVFDEVQRSRRERMLRECVYC